MKVCSHLLFFSCWHCSIFTLDVFTKVRSLVLFGWLWLYLARGRLSTSPCIISVLQHPEWHTKSDCFLSSLDHSLSRVPRGSSTPRCGISLCPSVDKGSGIVILNHTANAHEILRQLQDQTTSHSENCTKIEDILTLGLRAGHIDLNLFLFLQKKNP
ncbi:Hypothetical predicted protein [Pelobates cultripes]|uniref:Uncharacterized protein n=1 Tax=Pelobates cultripes TaxID=61616 RepID=A0AAD1R4X4_PELCU|nr:Hypothetical predicted protein [Pelobates cultripes]